MFPKANVIIILPPWYQWSILLTINVSKRVFISSLSFHMHTIMSYICLNIVNNLNIRFTLFLICFWSQTLSCMCLRIESQCIEVHWICSVLCIYIDEITICLLFLPVSYYFHITHIIGTKFLICFLSKGSPFQMWHFQTLSNKPHPPLASLRLPWLVLVSLGEGVVCPTKLRGNLRPPHRQWAAN